MVTIYTTCPASTGRSGDDFRRHVLDVADWTEQAGCRGFLVYTDNSLADPWLTAQAVLAHTETLVPLVAVQPAYMHPYTAARMVTSTAFLTGRQLDLNLVTGGFAGHLRALGDGLEHDERYRRLVRYALIIRRLLTEGGPISDDGDHYRLRAATIEPALDPLLVPRMFVSGSSDACRQASRELGVPRLSYPQPVGDYAQGGAVPADGIRIGIIARDTSAAAWRVARERFPADRVGERLHDIAARVVDSRWHQNLSTEVTRGAPDDTYWLFPFRTYKTFCPYLVGSHREVSELLARYLALGVSTLLLDVPSDADDLHHALTCVRAAETAVEQSALLPSG